MFISRTFWQHRMHYKLKGSGNFSLSKWEHNVIRSCSRHKWHQEVESIQARDFVTCSAAKMCEAYKVYFGMPVGDQDKLCTLRFIYELCKSTLEGMMEYFSCLDSGNCGMMWKESVIYLYFYTNSNVVLFLDCTEGKFTIPRIWREPTDCSNNFASTTI